MDNERVYGVKIKLIRDFYGLSQEKFAEKCGVSLSIISRYETNVVQPSIDFVKTLFFKLNVNPLWFFMDEGDVIIDTRFQLGDDLYDLVEKIRNNTPVRVLFDQALQMPEDENYFQRSHEIVNAITQILRAEKEEAKRKREREQLERAEKSRARKDKK